MKKVLAFGASGSKDSINKKFANYAAGKMSDVEINLIDLNDFEMPLYTSQEETANGVPNSAKEFKSQIDEADAIIISFAEYNGSFTAFYKNIYDWVSRIEGQVFQGKPLLLLATSPGGRGGKGVLAHAVTIYTHINKAEPITFSLPSFFKNFDSEKGILNEVLKTDFENKLAQFQSLIVG